VNVNVRTTENISECRLPGGPWIHATSLAERANFTACFWLGLREGSKKVMSPGDDGLEGGDIPSNTRIRGVSS